MRNLHLGLLSGALLALGACTQSSTPPGSASGKAEVSYPGLRFDTSAGSFSAVLYPEAAPETVARYLDYTASGYYMGRSFDRVVPGFVIQLTDCAISAATRDTRTLPLEVSEEHFFSAGALGIARSADPNSGGAEFFVMDFAAGHLNGDYTVWGQVVEGMAVVREAARVPALDFTAGGQAPAVVGDRCALEPVEINAVTEITVTLDEAQAARLPLRTAERVRTDAASYNLEWPKTLAAGADTDFTLYIRMNDSGQSPPAAQDLSITLGSQALAVEAAAAAPGIYRLRWTPPAAGDYDAIVTAGDTELAVLLVTVPD